MLFKFKTATCPCYLYEYELRATCTRFATLHAPCVVSRMCVLCGSVSMSAHMCRHMLSAPSAEQGSRRFELCTCVCTRKYVWLMLSRPMDHKSSDLFCCARQREHTLQHQISDLVTYLFSNFGFWYCY